MRRMGIGLGVGINRSNYAQGIFNAYSARVVADGGVVESGSCVDAVSSLLQSASLLLIPSGYKGGKLYSEIPTNGNGDLTWTRGSDAFRTNASGLIQRVPWNLFVQSQSFTSASWLSGGSGAGIYTDNFATAPDGTMTASRWTAAGSGYQTRQNVATINSTATLSVWMRSNSGTKTATLFINDGISDFSVISVTTTWQRFVLTANIGGTLSGGGRCGWYSNSVLTTSDYIEVWGAQYVEGSSAQTYLPTTDRLNFPRLSYMYGSCPSALLEPQRTNLALYSDAFDVSPWSAISATVTANTTISPDGRQNADTITTLSSSHNIRQSITVTANTTYTLSFYALRGTMTDLKYSVFDVSGGANIIAPTSYYSQTNSSSWSRISVTFTTPVGCTSIFVYPIRDSGATGTVFIYGAQLEAGAYPTTYIPTTSATATRVADSFSRSNIYTNGLISASGGTWFVELRGNVAYTRDAVQSNSIMLDTATGGLTNGFTFIGNAATGRLRLQKWVSGTGTVLYLTSADTVKIAIKWNGSTADIFENGVKVVSATSFTTTAMEFLNATTLDCPKFIQQMALFPTPLTDAQCQTLTT